MTVPGGHENSVRAIARFLAAPIHRPHMARVTSRRTWQWLVWCFRAAIVVLLALVAGSPPVVTYRLDALSHNYLHDAGTGGVECLGGGAVDVYAPSDGNEISGNEIGHIGSPLPCDHGGMNGIYVGGSNHHVANNIVWDVTGNCIQGWPYLNG